MKSGVWAVVAVLVCGCSSRHETALRDTGGPAEESVKVSSFGHDPVDSTRFLQTAFDSGLRKVIVDRQAGDWIVRPLFITNSNIEVVLENGVTVRAKRGEFYGKNDCLVTVTRGATNVTIRGEGRATLAMNKSDYLDPKQKYPHSEWRHAVSLLRASDVTVRNLTVLSSGGDGVYVNGARKVLLEDLTLRDHHRQGMSPISVEGLTVRRCAFNDTFGTPPQCGIDMEPNRWENGYTDVVYEDCRFEGNAMHGIDMYFGAFTDQTKPVSITYRRCVSRGNKGSGLSFMAGAISQIPTKGQVRGIVRFEDCRFEQNRSHAVEIMNHTLKGTDLSFVRCVFDGRGSGAESVVSLYDGQLNDNFGSVTFDDCELYADSGRIPVAYAGLDGYGVAGKVDGTLRVTADGKTVPFDFAAFQAKNAPHPEKIVRFGTMPVDYTTLAAPSVRRTKGVMTPKIRKPFVFVQAVAEAGDVRVRFRSKRLRTLGVKPVCGIVKVFDRMGTDLGQFELPEGDYTHVIKSTGPNVYRFEVSPRNTGLVRVAGESAGGALKADVRISLFGGKDEKFYFRVPAKAREVLVDVMAEERVSAKLYDGAGRLVAEMPYQGVSKVLKAVRQPSLADEVWTLAFPQIQEDMGFMIGGDAVPLVSAERDSVILAR